MKKLVGFCVALLASGWAVAGHSADYLFVHNGDRLSITDSGGDLVEFEFYSISGRSRIDIVCAGTGSGTRIFTNAQGWQTAACGGGMATITIRETGTNVPSKDSQGDIPGDSDVVIRTSNGKVSNLKGDDTAKKGTTCSVCKKTLIW